MYLSIIFSLCCEQAQQASRAIPVCSEVLQSNPSDVNVLKDRAEAYLQEEQYEEGKPDGVAASKSFQINDGQHFVRLARLTWIQ